MVLRTVAPETMAEDEHKIGDGYQTWWSPILAALPLFVAYFGDTKFVVAVSFSAVLFLLHEIGGRLHDLCIRLRRTNILISDQNSK